MELSEAIIALISTIFGGAGLKIIEHRLQNRKTKDNTSTELRDELRTDLKTIREEMERVRVEMNVLEREVDEWRKKYWDLYEKYIQSRQMWERSLFEAKGGKLND